MTRELKNPKSHTTTQGDSGRYCVCPLPSVTLTMVIASWVSTYDVHNQIVHIKCMQFCVYQVQVYIKERKLKKWVKTV